jgi:hypothetical protein
MRKAGGDKGGKYVNYLLSGRKKSTPDKRFTKGVKWNTEEEKDDTQVEEDALGDEEAPDVSALASFGHGATNRHTQNPNKELCKIDAVHVISYKKSKTVATPVQHPTDYGIQCQAEIDSHADTICCGKTFRVIKQTECIADVSGFHDNFGVLKEIPIATCCTAIDHPDRQETLIVVCHESLYFGNGMEDLLINPNQLRANGLVVDTCPKQFLGGQLMHGIYVPNNDLFILFCLHGCISYFSSRLPTDDKLATCRRITLSSKTP